MDMVQTKNNLLIQRAFAKGEFEDHRATLDDMLALPGLDLEHVSIDDFAAVRLMSGSDPARFFVRAPIVGGIAEENVRTTHWDTFRPVATNMWIVCGSIAGERVLGYVVADLHYEDDVNPYDETTLVAVVATDHLHLIGAFGDLPCSRKEAEESVRESQNYREAHRQATRRVLTELLAARQAA